MAIGEAEVIVMNSAIDEWEMTPITIPLPLLVGAIITGGANTLYVAAIPIAYEVLDSIGEWPAALVTHTIS
jgi:hypothetical protein